MSAVLMNRDGFQVPADGFYQIAPLGDFAHAQAGLVQVVDREACEAMVNRFNLESGREPFDKLRADRFAGLLVDFDHFSLDGEKRSEAAGWITALEARCQGSGFGVQGEASTAKDAKGREGGMLGNGAGLWAKIRWSDVGEEAVKGGRYRFLSPVWARSDCTDLGNGRVRPMRLLNAAVTNDPNLKGMLPLSNSGGKSEGCRLKAEGEEIGHEKAHKAQKGIGLVANIGGGQRFQWVLGDTKDGRHCPTCSRLAGQVHTMADWDAAGLRPGGAGLCCQGNCHCHLDETDEGSRGTLANTGWTNEARQASIEVRRAKAAARKNMAIDRQRVSMDKASKDYSAIFEQKGLDGMTTEEQDYMTARVGQRMRNGSALTPTEERFVREVRARDGGGSLGKTGGVVVKNSGTCDEGSGFGGQGEDSTARDAKGREGGEVRPQIDADLRRLRNGSGGETGHENAQAELLENVGWTDAARAASLAVRRAKAALRQTLHPQAQVRVSQGHSAAHGRTSRTGATGTVQQMSPADQEAYQADVAEGAQGAAEDISSGAAGTMAQGATDSRSGDMEGVFQEKGLDGMTTDQVIQFKDQLRDKLESGTEPLTPAEEGFLDALTEKSAQDAKKDFKQYTAAQAQAMQTRIDQKRQRGDNLSKDEEDFLKMSDPGNDGIDRANGGDPIVQWQMHRQQQKQRIQESTGMDANAAEAKAEDIQMRLDAGDAVSADERTFLDKMQRVIVQNRGDFYGDDAPYIEALVNTGWTDAARVAALAVRQAKGAVRVAGGLQPQVVKTPAPQPGTAQTPVDGGVYVGGSKNFDESTGRYRNQPAPGVRPPVVTPPVFPGAPSVPPGRRYSIVQPGSGTVRVSPVIPGLPVQSGQTGQLKKKVAVPGTSGYRFMASRARR